MVSKFALFFSITFFISFNSAHAKNHKACLLETNSTMMGIKLNIKDCLQNDGMTDKMFKRQCEGISQAAVSMGGPAAKITHLESCPSGYQAKCDNSKTAKAIYFYYKRASSELPQLKESCKAMQGVYRTAAKNI
jgi:hypothetical protein